MPFSDWEYGTKSEKEPSSCNKKTAFLIHPSVNPHCSDYSITINILLLLISETLGRISLPKVCVSVLMPLSVQECAFYFSDFNEKHVASNCLASAVESEGHVDVQCDRRGGKTLSGMVLNFSLPGHTVLGTTTELSFHF